MFGEFDAPWSISQLGARAEYRFCPAAAAQRHQLTAVEDIELDDYFHLYLANRGVLLTPFHNMALMCPETTEEQVADALEIMRAATAELAS